MAGPKGSKYYDVFLKYRIWLENNSGEGILGDGKLELIKTIGELGSLKAAADKKAAKAAAKKAKEEEKRRKAENA